MDEKPLAFFPELAPGDVNGDAHRLEEHATVRPRSNLQFSTEQQPMVRTVRPDHLKLFLSMMFPATECGSRRCPQTILSPRSIARPDLLDGGRCVFWEAKETIEFRRDRHRVGPSITFPHSHPACIERQSKAGFAVPDGSLSLDMVGNIKSLSKDAGDPTLVVCHRLIHKVDVASFRWSVGL